MKFLAYGGLRLLLFFLAFFVTVWLTNNWIFGTIIGLVVSFAIGYFVFYKLRFAAGQNLAEIFAPHRKETGEQEIADAEAEDGFTAGRFHDAQTQRAEAEAEAARARAEEEAREAQKNQGRR